MRIYEIIEKTKLVPVVVFKSLEDVKPTLDALRAGDVPIAEICFRTECAFDALKLAIEQYPDMLIGAGTVINKVQAVKAIEAGAKFIVSPGLSEDVNRVCEEYGVFYLPGIVTPTEIMKALDLGINYVKFFPAGVFGGLKAIKALSAAFPQVRFMPTGGVNNENLKEFVSEESIFAIGGSWLLKGDTVKNCLQARAIIKGE